MVRRNQGGFRQLVAWQEAKALSIKIYGITAKFPSDERFRLVDQMTRAASSIMANIAEGSAMPTKPHRNDLYARARGSAVEIDNFIELIAELQYITPEEYDDLTDHVARVMYLITRLINSK